MEFLNEIQREVLKELKNVFPERDINFLVQKVAAYEVPDANLISMDILGGNNEIQVVEVDDDEENQDPNPNEDPEVPRANAKDVAKLFKEYLPKVDPEFLEQKALEFHRREGRGREKKS